MFGEQTLLLVLTYIHPYGIKLWSHNHVIAMFACQYYKNFVILVPSTNEYVSTAAKCMYFHFQSHSFLFMFSRHRQSTLAALDDA